MTAGTNKTTDQLNARFSYRSFDDSFRASYLSPPAFLSVTLVCRKASDDFFFSQRASTVFGSYSSRNYSSALVFFGLNGPNDRRPGVWIPSLLDRTN